MKMNPFSHLEVGAIPPLPEELCAARVPLSSCINVVGPVEALPVVHKDSMPARYDPESSPLTAGQPPDPWSLFPESDPQKQLELFSLAARFRAAMRDQVSNVYKRARYLPEHRLYSQTVLLAMQQKSGDPPSVEQVIGRITKLFPRNTDEYYPPRLRRWQVLETMTQHWTEGPARPITEAWRRSREIIPPVIINERSRKLRMIRSMKIAKRWQDTQDAYKKAQQARQEADEAQLVSVLFPDTGEHLVQSVGKSIVDQAVEQYRNDRGKGKTSRSAKQSKKRSRTAKEQADQIIREGVEQARHESRVQLKQLDGVELTKGVIDLALFPDITNNKPDFGPGALNTFILDYTRFRMGADTRARSIKGLPTEYLALNSLLLLRGKPVYWRDISYFLGASKDEIRDSFGILRNVFNISNQNLLLKEGPGMPVRQYREQVALCLNPRVRIVDMRREHHPEKVPQHVYSAITPTETKPRVYGRLRGRRYEERQKTKPAWAQKSYPED